MGRIQISKGRLTDGALVGVIEVDWLIGCEDDIITLPLIKFCWFVLVCPIICIWFMSCCGISGVGCIRFGCRMFPCEKLLLVN